MYIIMIAIGIAFVFVFAGTLFDGLPPWVPMGMLAAVIVALFRTCAKMSKER